MSSIPLPSKQEMEWVKAHMLAPVILEVLERDIGTINTVGLKMPHLYVKSLRRIQDQVEQEAYQIRKHFRTHGIKVYEMKRTELGIEAAYLCRGYHQQMFLLWSRVRSEVEEKLHVYLGIQAKSSQQGEAHTT